MDDGDVEALAVVTIESHRQDAVHVLTERIAELKAKGDHEWAAIWTRVRDKITADAKG